MAALEKGTVRETTMAAVGRTGTGFPVNAPDGHSTRINVLLLWLSAAEQGFGYDIWLTATSPSGYSNWVAMSVKRREMATNLVIFKPVKVPAKDRHGELLHFCG